MIKYQSQSQLSIEEFTTPFQQKLIADNRWVKLSRIIPWDDLAKSYYKSLSNDQGRPGIDARRIIGALIIKHKLNLSDEETVLQIQENAYLQYFLGYSSYESKLVFSPTLFVEIRKRIGNEQFDEMQSSIIKLAFQAKRNKPGPRHRKAHLKDNDGDNGGDSSSSSGNSGEIEEPKNKGKLLMDATVAEQKIKYPNDLELLNDSRMECEEIIDLLYPLSGLKKKPRTYRRNARKEFLAIAKQKQKNKKMLRKAIGKQLNYLARDIKHIEQMLELIHGMSFPLKAKWQKTYWIVKEIYRQQKYMYDTKQHSCPDRIVSISQPHVRPIVRGKTKTNVEFGSKIGVSMVDGYAVPDTISWNAYNESSDLKKHVEKYFTTFGYYPEAVLADTIYGNRVNRTYLKSKGIRFIGKPLGRPKKETEENKEDISKERQQRKRDYRERIPIEGKFGQGKNGYNLNKIKAKLQNTSEAWINSIFFVMNIVKLASEKINSFFLKAIFVIKFFFKTLIFFLNFNFFKVCYAF